MSPTESQPSSQGGLLHRTLRRHWRGIMAAWVLGSLALGVLAYQYLLPTYKAVSLLRVDPSPTDLFGVRGTGDSIDAFLETQVQLISSPNALTSAGTNPKVAVLDRFQKAGDVVQELRKAINVSVIPKTFLIEVSSISPNSYEAATVVNAVVEAFMEANSEWADGSTRAQIRNLDAYNNDLKNQTDELERRWKTLAAKGDIDIAVLAERMKGAKAEAGAERTSITIEEYKLAYRDLKAVQLELAEAKAWLSTAKAALVKDDKVVATAGDQAALERQDKQIERMFNQDSEVLALKGEMRKAQVKLSEASTIKTKDGDPDEIAARRKLASLAAQYKRLWDEKQPIFREQLTVGANGDKVLNPDQEVKEATNRVEKLLVRQTVLKDNFDKLDVKNKTNATDTVEIELIRGERDTLKGMQEAVTRRLEQLRFEAKGEARIRPVNAAVPPGKPYQDRRLTVLGAIPGLVFLGIFGLFVGIEAFSSPTTRSVAEKAEPPKEV